MGFWASGKDNLLEATQAIYNQRIGWLEIAVVGCVETGDFRLGSKALQASFQTFWFVSGHQLSAKPDVIGARAFQGIAVRAPVLTKRLS
jgi:hypothetical protein